MNEICKNCNNDLRDIKNYLISHFQLPQNTDISREMRDFKKLIREDAIENYDLKYIIDFYEHIIES